MKNCWYADNRDLIKWSVLMHLAIVNSASRILQIAYLQEHTFPKIDLDKEEKEIPEEVQAHFRDIRNIESLSSPVKINVFSKVITDRKNYLLEAKEFISLYKEDKCIVFLDPDTGLEPTTRPTLKHVLNDEANDFWSCLKSDDILVLYQHQTNKNGNPWVEPRRMQFEKSIGASRGSVKIGRGPRLAKDVVLLYAVKA
ncbi:MAG: hypothetical protein ACYC6Q_06500 [Syntrophales bacterium]